jgi:hypothetical protein
MIEYSIFNIQFSACGGSGLCIKSTLSTKRISASSADGGIVVVFEYKKMPSTKYNQFEFCKLHIGQYTSCDSREVIIGNSKV